MGISMKNFEMPKNLILDESTATPEYGKFIAEPFERGYGMTVGNSLRRVLISSIEGTAVTSVKIDGVHHEFSAIKGVVEDVPQIILNIKKLVMRSHFKTPRPIHISVSKKGAVTAKDIKINETIEVINPDLHICTLTKDVSLKIEMQVARGRGYVPADRNKKESQPIGVIAIDSIFTPVRRVNFDVENTRVGQITDYDKLILEVWTNGAIAPKEALLYASNILQRHLDVFVNFGKLPEEEDMPEETEDQKLLKEKMKVPISELELSVRSSNCLKEARIKTIGDLVRRSELDMLQYRNFGKKSLAEIKKVIVSMGLSLGMKVEGKEAKAEEKERKSK
jgi:DNA-directed RNA polymerase subunit alpha